MRTVEKALRLLDFFDDKRSEIGVSELARLSGIDKATALRMLADMAATGLVEQEPQTKLWRLGAGILRLARLREAHFPVERVLTPIMEALAEATGETVHASLLAGLDLSNIGVVEGPRATRVHIEPGLRLPLHATASGIVFTAFARPDLAAEALARPLAGITEQTPVTAVDFAAKVGEARLRGFACADQTYEAEVYGIAMPLFGADGYACGALAVASPMARMTPARQAEIVAALAPAAARATQGLGGRIPPHHRIAA